MQPIKLVMNFFFKRPLAFLICLFIFFSSISCEKKKINTDEILKNLYQEGWTPVDSLYPESSNWRMANSSYWEWNVKMEKGKLKIYDTLPSYTTIYKLKDGYLEGSDKGEWKGKLVYNYIDTIQKKKTVLEGNIKAIFEFNKDIYILEGTEHLNRSHGKMLKLIKQNENIGYETYLNLNDCPYAYTISENNELFIVTSEKLVKIKNNDLEVIIDSAFWQGLYPNSIVINNEKAIIGMRGILSFINLEDRKILNLKK